MERTLLLVLLVEDIDMAEVLDSKLIELLATAEEAMLDVCSVVWLDAVELVEFDTIVDVIDAETVPDANVVVDVALTMGKGGVLRLDSVVVELM